MDKYDVLMNLKRQGTTGTNTNTATVSRSTAAPSATSTPEATPTPTPTPTPSSSPVSTPVSTPPPTSRTTTPATSTPVSSSAPPSSSPPTSSALPTSSSALPTSTPVTTPSSTLVASSTPVTSSTATTPTTSSTPLISPTVIPIGTNSRTTLSIPLTAIRTTSGGVVYTVTAIVGQPSGSATAAAAKKPFFQNTGAVVGVFVVVGIAATALAVFVITLFLRRRRAKAFDREVQDAAREAALAQAPVDDDDYGGGASYNTHASKPMSTEQDRRYGAGYGSSNASSWDPYARGGAAAAVGGYEMHQRRTSTGTAPGMAGFAAGESFARGVGVDPPQQAYNQPQGYGPGYGQQQQQAYNNQGYNNQGYNNQQQQQGYQAYNNTSPPQTYALAQERGPTRAPPQPKMMMPEAQQQARQNYNTVDAYRPGPSYGQAHPGEQVEYGHAYGGEDLDRGRQSEDPYGGYEGYEYGSNSQHASGSNGGPPAYVAPGASGNAGATGDRKGGAGLTRQPSAATHYSQDSDGSVDERPGKRVLKVANE